MDKKGYYRDTILFFESITKTINNLTSKKHIVSFLTHMNDSIITCIKNESGQPEKGVFIIQIFFNVLAENDINDFETFKKNWVNELEIVKQRMLRDCLKLDSEMENNVFN